MTSLPVSTVNIRVASGDFNAIPLMPVAFSVNRQKTWSYTNGALGSTEINKPAFPEICTLRLLLIVSPFEGKTMLLVMVMESMAVSLSAALSSASVPVINIVHNEKGLGAVISVP